jgi:hypothetical protein
VRFPVLVPEAVDGALARPLLPFGVLSALPLRLLRCNLDRVRSAIWFLFWFLLFICSAHVLTDHNRILVQRRVGPHGHAIAGLARGQLPVLVCLVIDVSEGRIRLPRMALVGVLDQHLLLAHLRRVTLRNVCQPRLVHRCAFRSHA